MNRLSDDLPVFSTLTGLRAPVAIVEALRECGVIDDPAQALFIALRAVKNGLLPSKLFQPSSIADADAMVEALTPKRSAQQLRICHPFNGREQPDNEGFWMHLERMLQSWATVCALMRLSQPEGHWIIAREIDGAFEFVDPFDRILKEGRLAIQEARSTGQPRAGWQTRRESVVLFQKRGRPPRR